MKGFAHLRLAAAKVKDEQIRQSGASVPANTYRNCLVKQQDISRHYRMGVKVKPLSEIVADALLLEAW